MTEDHRLSKVHILIEQEKYSTAEEILSELLREDSNNIEYLSYLAEVYLQQDEFDKANQIIDNSIGLSPDEPHLFFTKARVAIQQDRFTDAEKYLNQAIELDPYDADYFALLANIKMARKQYDAALKNADKALEIDAENLLALNTRSSALNKLNRNEESHSTIEGALREDPNNAYTHANYGWNLLEQGDHKKALTHFKESLTNDPNFEYAQAGMLEAIKATNPIYRAFLKYSFWMSNMTSKYQWGVIIGFYLGFRVLRTVATSNEALQPILFPLLFIIGFLAFSTWIIGPLSNLFLRFNPYGKLLLNKTEKMSSNFVAVSFGIFILGILLYFALSDQKMLALAVFGFAMMLPLGTMFSPSKNKSLLKIYTMALAAVGIIAIALTFSTGQVFNAMSIVFLLGFVAFQWVANYILIKENNI